MIILAKALMINHKPSIRTFTLFIPEETFPISLVEKVDIKVIDQEVIDIET